jgi:hypothetical protein
MMSVPGPLSDAHAVTKLPAQDLDQAVEGFLEGFTFPYKLDADHTIRVGPTARRKILPGPDGVRLLAIGGYPGMR